MRGRNIRMFLLILLILGLALASLAFREVNVAIPGLPRLNRGGTGPLGLKLGLDLRGGGHLVYQADTGSRIDVTFGQPIKIEQIRESLADPRFLEPEVEPRGDRSVLIKTALLDPTRRRELREALQSKLGAIETFQVTEIPKPTADKMAGVEDIIKRRVNLFGTDEPIIQRFGDERIIVQLPGAGGSRAEFTFQQPANVQKLAGVLTESGLGNHRIEPQTDRRFIIKTATLSDARQQELRDALVQKIGPMEPGSFKVVSGIDEAKKLIGQTARLEFKERTCSDVSCITFKDDPISDPNLSGDDLASAFAATHPNTGEWVVNIEFKGRGTELFSDLTRRIVGQPTKRIAVFRDEELLIAPVAQAWIRDGRSQITGGFTREEARILAIQLEAGRLPVPLKLIQESDVDALLGSESLRRSLIAGFVGLGLVMVFMLTYYRLAGLASCLALVFYAVVVLAVFKLIPVTLTLSGIAGFVLSIGMAVDANVLIFERMKEEMRIGRTLASSMEVGFSRAWTAIRDSNVSTFITCAILLWFGTKLGGGLVTGFALTLFIGVAVSMFTAVVVSRNLLQVLAWAGLARRVELFTPEPLQRTAGAPGGGR